MSKFMYLVAMVWSLKNLNFCHRHLPLDSYLKYQTPVSVEIMPANEYEYFSQFVMPIAIPLKAQYIYQDSKL